MLNKNEKTLLWIIFILSIGATVWSLYYGWYGDPIANIASGDLFNPENGFPPCTLCWYARILQYPIVILSGLGLYYHDRKVATRYILPLAVIWVIVDLYKRLLEEGILMEWAVCDPNAVSCGVKYVDYFGFLTLPLMGIIVFIAIIICVILLNKQAKNATGK